MTPEAFIEKWAASGGAELANSQPFLLELCDLVGVPRPDPTQTDEARNDYTYERAVRHTERGVTSVNRIDLYKRGCFILESKQGAEKRSVTTRHPGQGDLALAGGQASAPVRAGTAPRGTTTWDRAMRRAYAQAKGYVADLPADHAAPPFLVVVDVGHVIELHADFSGQGRNYTQFPDRAGFQIRLADLADPAIRARLHAVWTDPASLDPSAHAAAVTRQIAERLAIVAAQLEARNDPAQVAAFLMRCIFTMFAEDVALIPADSFETLLADLETRPADFAPALEALWASMDKGTYDGALGATLRKFNGFLFKDRAAFPLDAAGIRELGIAARADCWREVEPAIFGTLLERALNPRERAALGAHYTPRAYVERLVGPTIIDPLREDWGDAQGAMARLVDAGDDAGALAVARAFHHQLCTTRVLDPACGTGNFLYVALEMMKRLEGEVLEAVEALGGQAGLGMAGETVDPSQFLGLELNPRAVPIAELVLWVGYLQWQVRTGGTGAVSDPVLRAHGNIRHRDALLDYDARTERTDALGMPITVWDRFTTRASPVTGLPVPDETARLPTYDYANPRRADWPEAEFIVGNPPFIGGKDLRAELGDGYAEALWAARPEVKGGADLVMHWWDEAARRLTAAGTRARPNPLRRFGFITTNSLTQTFSRRVLERHMTAKRPLHLAFAVADHPWVKGGGRAAVRIAMTVAARGKGEGVLGAVASVNGLDTDAPQVRLDRRTGTITAKLALGADVTAATPLLANAGLSSPGVKLHGAGFIVAPARARALGLGRVEGLEAHILPYLNFKDLTQRTRGVMVIDLYGMDAEEVRNSFPEVYQHLSDVVRPNREAKRGQTADATAYADAWWLFGKVRGEMRAFTGNLARFVVTGETGRHRTFRFLPAGTRPDNKLIAIGMDGAAPLALLSSRVHVLWAIASGNRMGVGNDPVYAKTQTFDPFPFPATLTDDTDPAIATRDRLRELGERLEALRTERLAAIPTLTLTGLYNRLERRREALAGGDPLTEDEAQDHARAHVPLLAELHDDIDRAALATYGWHDLAPALVGRPGGTLPSAVKGPAQEAAEAELLSRLVALNAERRAEEVAGRVRWLRPAYQAPRLGARLPSGQGDLPMDAPGVPAIGVPWPEEPRAQFAAVRAALEAAPAGVGADAIARAFTGRATSKRRTRVADVLAVLADLGLARAATSGDLAAIYALRTNAGAGRAL